MNSSISAEKLSRALALYREILAEKETDINDLNVYPVPDSDTGTNMAQTVDAVVTELGRASTVDEVCDAVVHGSLRGSRGNSGLILSQVLRALSESLRKSGALGPPELARGLDRAVHDAYAAVGDPVEGTILTVLTAARNAAAGTSDAAIEGMLTSCREAAYSALEDTTRLLPDLERAGVVDAGGWGLALMFDAFLGALNGVRPIDSAFVPARPAHPPASRGRAFTGGRYEVIFYVDVDGSGAAALKSQLREVGDSIALVGGDRKWKCHVHTDRVEDVLTMGRRAGEVDDVQITDLLIDSAAEPITSVVAFAGGPGIARMFSDFGAHVVEESSVELILQTASALEKSHVVVLPNDPQLHEELVRRAVEADVHVVPARSPAAGLAALIAYDPQADHASNARAMDAAAGKVRAGAVAKRTSREWLASAEGRAVGVHGSPSGAVLALVEDLVARESELITVIEGRDAAAADRDAITGGVAQTHPHVTVEFHEGGQVEPAYALGVE